ncbi:MAG: hypothetical protein MZV70_20375 [Desulfobacterales bacterium]|nr:hypothetical protein [Desulfobacterales bacterium]
MSGGEPFLDRPLPVHGGRGLALGDRLPARRRLTTPAGSSRRSQWPCAEPDARETVWAVCPGPARAAQGPSPRPGPLLHVSPLAAGPPARLERLAEPGGGSRCGWRKASLSPPAHRRLWAEFTGRVALPAERARAVRPNRGRALSRPPGCPCSTPGIQHGHLAACLLLDSAPRRFHELPHRRPLPHPLHAARLGPAFPRDDPDRPRGRARSSCISAWG